MDIPLLWMRKIDDLNKRITRSLHPGWWLLESLPFNRLLYYNSDRHTFGWGYKTWFGCHLTVTGPRFAPPENHSRTKGARVRAIQITSLVPISTTTTDGRSKGDGLC